jgi:spectinomycin phosphotransferase
MRSPLASAPEPSLASALAEDWGISPVILEYLPVGGGSYHWLVKDGSGGRFFLTIDDLDSKPFLGKTRDSAFDGLRRALDTAGALRDEAGLEFVVAPLPALTGQAVLRLDAGLAAALYPFVEGAPGSFGQPLPPGEQAELVCMLARLHRIIPRAVPSLPTAALSIPGRDDLEGALQYLDREWTGGPFSEPARALLARRADHVRRLLQRFDQEAVKAEAARSNAVPTHGEPHGGNVIRSPAGLRLVDWDTVALAPPERDLWHVESGDGAALDLYTKQSGRTLDPALIDFYRLRWTLDDVSSFLLRLRLPHRRDDDTEHAWRALVTYLGRES